MANFFNQFDEKPAQTQPNFFDQFDEKPQPSLIGNVARRIVREIPETLVALPLRGAGAVFSQVPGAEQQYERDRLSRAVELARSGVDPATAQEQATAETPQPKIANPPAEHPLFQAGKAVSEAVDRAVPYTPNKGWRGLVEDVAGGFAQVGAHVGAAMVPFAGPAAMVATIPFQGSGEAIDNAIKAGASPEQQVRAAQLGLAPGMLEFADLALPFLPAGAFGRVFSKLPPFGRRVVEGVFIEGGTEGLQQFVQNLIAQSEYKPDQVLSEGVLYNALVGGIVGGGARGILGGREQPSTPAVPGQTQDALVALMGGSPGAPSATPPVAPGGEGAMPAPITAPSSKALDAGLSTWMRQYLTLYGDQQGAIPSVAAEGQSMSTEGPRSATAAEVQAVQEQRKAGGEDVIGSANLATTIKADIPEVRLRPGGDFDYPLFLDGQEIDHLEVRTEDGNLQIRGAYIDDEFQNKGHVIAAYQRLADWALANGRELQSDVGVSPQSARVYAALARRGYTVEQNPESEVADDGAIGASGPVFRVTAGPRVQPSEMSQRVVAALAQAQASTSAAQSPVEAATAQPSNDKFSMADEIQARPGVEAQRLARLLGPKLYGDPADIAQVSVKEMVQNSFDALKGALEAGRFKQNGEAKIDVSVNMDARTITVQDNGLGMVPDTLAGPFLRIAGTKKESANASGGLGIAKMLFLFGNKDLRVTTMRDGKVAELIATGEQLFSALDDQSQAPRIQVRKPTRSDTKLFPEGHGTVVEVTVPASYRDPGTGEQKTIDFPTGYWDFPVLNNSPLFAPITISLNGLKLDIGSRFPNDDFTRFANVKFDWGDARIYITKQPQKYTPHHNVRVLSNGLWQFSSTLTVDGSPWGERVPYLIYIDVASRVGAEEAGYPFDLNRQQFSPNAMKGFDQLLQYLVLQNQEEGFRDTVANFGDVEYLTLQGSRGKFTLIPDIPPKEVGLSPIREGETVRVEDGQLVIQGRKVPEITPEMLAKAKINFDELLIDQSKINPNEVMLHDNVNVKVSNVEVRSVVELMRERFGRRFDNYMLHLGMYFQLFRKQMYDLVQSVKMDGNYIGILEGGIGISFDTNYRGVSIRIPFTGVFVNPGLPKFKETPELTGVSIAMTMLHEFTHHSIRTEGNEHKREMEMLLVLMDVNPGIFNWQKFKSGLSAVVRANWDIQQTLTGVFSGAVDIQPAGRHLKGVSEQYGRNASGAGDLARPSSESGRESQLPQGPGPGESASVAESRPPNVSRRERSASSDDNGYAANRAYFERTDDGGDNAVPEQPEIRRARAAIKKAFKGTPPVDALAQAGWADKVTKFTKYALGIHQLVQRNPNHAPLVVYNQLRERGLTTEGRVLDPAIRMLKEWRSLGTRGEGPLLGFIDDLNRMTYRSEEEKRIGQPRMPTQQEFDALVTKHRLDNETLRFFQKMRNAINIFVRLAGQTLAAQVEKQGNFAAAQRIRNDVDTLLTQRPYFPIMHFGEFYIEVRDPSGRIVHREFVDRRGARSAARMLKIRRREIERNLQPGEKMVDGVVPKSIRPMMGLPPVMLDAMPTYLELSPEQLEHIQLLQHTEGLGLKPVLAARFQKRYFLPSYGVYTPGYSMDFKRSFAKFFFHGARYLGKLENAREMREQIELAKLMPGVKNSYIRDYMTQHYHDTVTNVQGDHGLLKGLTFFMALAWSPAAALINATQVVTTHNWMASKFGDRAATAEMLRANARRRNFYKRGQYFEPGLTDFHLKAIAYAIKARRITESQAAELAGYGESGNLLAGIAGNRAQRALVWTQEAGSFMFEMVEQWLRRTTFDSALNLALRNPTAKVVEEAVKINPMILEDLQYNEGFSEAQARAIVTALYAVDDTQYVYAKSARAPFMRGKWPGTILIFKQYIQSMLAMLGHNRDMWGRFFITTAVLGGLQGLPGMDDLQGLLELVVALLQKIAPGLLGRDFNIEREVRRLIMDNSSLPPDLLLHGLSQQGFGIPWAMDALGGLMTGTPGRSIGQAPIVEPGRRVGVGENVPMPVFNFSRSYGAGPISPVDFGQVAQLFQGGDTSKIIAEQTQRASGAAFSMAFNMLLFLGDKNYDIGDLKRWERIMPRAARGISQSFRAFTEGRDRTKGGPAGGTTVINYDVRDTEQMAEVLGMAAGFQPLRKTAKWDLVVAQQESERYFTSRRNILMGQMWEAVKGGRKEEIDSVSQAIANYNRDLPDWMRKQMIKGDSISKSIQTRQRALNQRESGQGRNPAANREMQRLYPWATIDVRSIK